MPFSSLLDRPSVRSTVNAHLRLPQLLPDVSPILQGGSAHRGLVGLAFEFVLVAGLRARSPAVRGELVAPRLALEVIESWGSEAVAACRLPELRARVAAAEDVLRQPTDDALAARHGRAAFDLAAVAALARAPIGFREDILARGRMRMFEPPDESLCELRQLHAMVPWLELVGLGRVHLAPTLTRIAEGRTANADLLLGDTIIEVEASTERHLQHEGLRRAAVLGVLARRFGVIGADDGVVTNVGVYVARTGTLHRFKLDSLLVPAGAAAIAETILSAALEDPA